MNYVDFYRDIHGRDPWPWQIRLSAALMRGERPSIAAPTGTGKTSAILTAWTWAQRHGKAPLRLVYVIDRRMVVDSVSAEAQRIATALRDTAPLVTQLRGGIERDDGWAANPTRPAIIISTVDQVGSRLLFRGYGVSPRIWPIHAALVGNDALWVIDEAHLSAPLLTTLARCRELGANLDVIEMTATPDVTQATIGLNEADYATALGQRLRTAKPVTYVNGGANPVRALIGQARTLAETHRTVGVVCNTVATARTVAQALDAVLLTGRIRELDRQRLLDRVLPHIETGSTSTEPMIVVATQTIEVGADLDFDALVTESANLSAVRQRAGRVARAGRETAAPIVIISNSADRVYGKGHAKAVWEWLREHVTDLGIRAMQAVDIRDCPQPERRPCPVLPTHVLDMLSQTTVPVDIDVSLYLHGIPTSTDVNLIWRSDLNKTDSADWIEIVRAFPPHHREMMAVPIAAVRRWLKGEADTVADIEGTVQYMNQDSTRQVLRWGDPPALISAQAIRTGDTLIIPAEWGGSDRFGWLPGSGPVEDQAERVQNHRRRLTEAEVAAVQAALDDDEPIDPAITLTPAGGVLTLHRQVDDDGLRSVPVALEAHLHGVAEVAREWGCSAEVIRACALHDIGKADARFQVMLHGGVTGTELLAKSGMRTQAEMRRAWALSGLPSGWRHEAASVVLAHDEPNLVRYLIGTHHGYGRPWFPGAEAGQPGLEWAELFMALQREYGHWGLALLETQVRLADWHRSQRELEATGLTPGGSRIRQALDLSAILRAYPSIATE